MKWRNMREIKCVATSDLHGLLPSVPKADLLLMAGDVCPVIGSHGTIRQTAWLEKEFFPWCSGLIESGRVSEIALTPGNHDFVFQRHPLTPTPEHVHLLIDREVTLHGLRVYGSPWCTQFGGWAFMLDSDGLTEKFSKIPEGLDILITHGPAYGACDEILRPQWGNDNGDPHLGSAELRKRIEAVKPKRHFCGHIHTGDHKPSTVISGVISANVSLLDEGYNRIYSPLEFSVFMDSDG